MLDQWDYMAMYRDERQRERKYRNRFYSQRLAVKRYGDLSTSAIFVEPMFADR